MTGQVANSGSGSISVTGGSFATAELEDFIDPDRTIILTLELGEGAAGAAAMEATMVNPARAEIVARPRCVVVFIIVPPTLP